MSDHLIEGHFLIQAVLIVVVSVAMLYTGKTAGTFFQTRNLPYGEWLGFVVGATLIFIPFALLYKRYEAFYDATQ